LIEKEVANLGEGQSGGDTGADTEAGENAKMELKL